MSNVAPGWHRDRALSAKWTAIQLQVTTGGVDNSAASWPRREARHLWRQFPGGPAARFRGRAAYVMSACPSSIVGIEIGNEPEQFGSWADQTTAYEKFADAILAAPGALLVGRPAPAKLT